MSHLMRISNVQFNSKLNVTNEKKMGANIGIKYKPETVVLSASGLLYCVKYTA